MSRNLNLRFSRTLHNWICRELDLEEFSEIIHKLKINASEDFVARYD